MTVSYIFMGRCFFQPFFITDCRKQIVLYKTLRLEYGGKEYT